MKEILFEKNIYRDNLMWELLNLKALEVAYWKLHRKGIITNTYLPVFIDGIFKSTNEKHLNLMNRLILKLSNECLLDLLLQKEKNILNSMKINQEQ
jgi:hypothetical protein